MFLTPAPSLFEILFEVASDLLKKSRKADVNRCFLLIMLFFVFSVILSPQSAFAWPPTYGREFNFTSDEIYQAFIGRKEKLNGAEGWEVPDEAENKAAKAFADEVQARCGRDCTVTPKAGKFETDYRVVFKNGYSFTISVDPSCVEIISDPESLKQMKDNRDQTEKFIFSVAKDVGLRGDTQTAHFNIGIRSAFEGDPEGFLRMFVNYHNFVELNSGILGANYSNAPPISHLKAKQRAALAKIVDAVNHGNFKSVKDLAMRIQKEVYTSSPTFNVGEHYQAISVKYVHKSTSIENDRPFEFRSPRQPLNADENILLAELFEKRIQFEKKNQEPVAFLDVPKEIDFTSSQLSNRFRLYLEEMEADWDHFKPLLPDYLSKEPPDAFMSGKINWTSKADVDVVKAYTRYIANSAWVRDKMRTYLNEPEALASGNLKSVLDAAKENLGSYANKDAAKIVKTFIKSFDDVHNCVAQSLSEVNQLAK